MTTDIGAAAACRLLPSAKAATMPKALALHRHELGPLPDRLPDEALSCIHASGLRGRGGASFPTGVKWQAVAERSRRDAVVVVNAAEGEPASRKDDALLRMRPHLVLDGAVLAARSVGATDAVVYVRERSGSARRAVEAALAERADTDHIRWHVALAPDVYVAGEETAVIRRLNGGPARPTPVPPRPYERGVAGRPTLVQNVETLAHAALILRHGADWFRTAGTATCPGTALFTVWTQQRRQVVEAELGTRLGALLESTGVSSADAAAILLGGYFGRFLTVDEVADLVLDETLLHDVDATLGCGVVAVIPRRVCPLAEASRIAAYLARETAGQCGPCVRGLPAISEATARLVRGGAPARAALADLERWAGQVAGRGACHHPDGAVRLVASVQTALAAEIDKHARTGPCERTGLRSTLPGVPPVTLGNLRW